MTGPAVTPPGNYSSLSVFLFFVLLSMLPPITSIFDMSSDEVLYGLDSLYKAAEMTL